MGDFLSGLFGKKRKKRIASCPDRYREQAERALASAEAKLGFAYKGEGITVTTKPAERKIGWMWCGRSPTGQWGGAYASGTAKRQAVVLFVDPSGAETDCEFEHEMGHCVLWSVNYPGDHHAFMKSRGLYAKAAGRAAGGQAVC